jgi:hypothetical protein
MVMVYGTVALRLGAKPYKRPTILRNAGWLSTPPPSCALRQCFARHAGQSSPNGPKRASVISEVVALRYGQAPRFSAEVRSYAGRKFVGGTTDNIGCYDHSFPRLRSSHPARSRLGKFLRPRRGALYPRSLPAQTGSGSATSNRATMRPTSSTATVTLHQPRKRD